MYTYVIVHVLFFVVSAPGVSLGVRVNRRQTDVQQDARTDDDLFVGQMKSNVKKENIVKEKCIK